jgi:transposase
MHLLDALHLVVTDSDFTDLFPLRGQPAQSPARLALVSLLQFMEGLTDRQAAEAVRTRIDWKYLLGLELCDPGFDHTVLSEFRSRLLAHGAERRLFDAVLALAQTQGLVQAGGRQRSDSTHVLGKIRMLGRYELVAETLRHALDVLADAAPDWLRAHVTPAWVERYRLRSGGFGWPKGAAHRKEWITQTGADGMALLSALMAQDAPAQLRQLPALETLRQVWVQNFLLEESADELRVLWRAMDNIPRAGIAIASPYDTEARRGCKGQTEWVGFKVHLTETCETATPNLITNVETTAATVTDDAVTPVIHAALEQRALLPSLHIADTAYVNSALLVQSREHYGLELVGPTRRDNMWQAKQADGFTVDDFSIDFASERAVCPAGKTSLNWQPTLSPYGKPIIKIRWSRNDCGSCKVHERCTRSTPPQRQITVCPQPQHEALRERRAHEQTGDFAAEYARRAGIEGTISQAVRAHAMRRTRYIGQARTHLAHLMMAAAINVGRLLRWIAGEPKACVTRSSFERLFAAVV